MDFVCLSHVVLFSQTHTKLPLPTVLRTSLKTFSMETLVLSKTGSKHTLSFHRFYSSPYNFGNCLLACIHMHLTPFMGGLLTGQCAESVCFLLNSETYALVGTKSELTGFRTKRGHGKSYRTHILYDAHVGKCLWHVVLN